MRVYLTWLTLMLGSLSVKAQHTKHCGSDEAEKRIINKFPELKSSIANTNSILESLNQGQVSRTRSGKYIIPVVFHIIHNFGPENISDAQVYDAMQRINDDYNKLNADVVNTIPEFQPLVANCGFEFKLATKDPDGNCTNGIDRIWSYKTYQADDQAKLNIWNPTRYLNIWVVNSIGSSGTAAYAYKPPTANFLFYYDGIICLYDYVGGISPSNITHQHTLSHEIGHYLNLDHTWGSTNQPGVSCGDDGVGDTPKTMGHSNCNTLFDDYCEEGVNENIQNFMEYSYCSTMFTEGQKNRMIVTLDNLVAQRKFLWDPITHNYTGCLLPRPDCAPHAEFRAARQYTCVGSPITLNAGSWGDSNLTHLWSSPDGSFSSTSTSNTQVTFNSSGWKEVTLQSSSNAGSDIKTKTAFIYVSDNTAQNPDNQIESFDSKNTWPNWPILNYFNNTFRWQFTEDAGYWGNRSLMYKVFDERGFPANKYGSPAQDWDDVMSPAYDLSSYSSGNAFLSFRSSSATTAGFGSAMDDSLQIQFSTNCGGTWQNLKTLKGSELNNVGSVSGVNFIPVKIGDWTLKQFSLPSSAITSNTIFRLRYRPGDLSNNFYLDNWQITRSPNTLNELRDEDGKIVVSPNPSDGIFQLHTYELPTQSVLDIKVVNITGNVVFQTQSITGSQTSIPIDLSSYPSGFYFLQVSGSNYFSTQKLILE